MGRVIFIRCTFRAERSVVSSREDLHPTIGHLVVGRNNGDFYGMDKTKMSPEVLSWIAAIVAVIGAGTTLIKAVKTPPSEKADVAQKYQTIASKAADDAKEAIDRCNILEDTARKQARQIQELSAILDEYKHGTFVLISQLEANGIPPGWKPRHKENTGG